MDYSPTKIKLIHVFVLYLMLCLHLSITSTTGYLVLSPQRNYTVFENNASAVFYCSGDGTAVVWYLNGTTYNAMHAQMGIRVFLNPPTGTVVSSNLYIPSTSNNKTNNTEVLCKAPDGTFTNIQTSEPANLVIQGRLDAPYNFSVAMSNTSFILSWGAPFSLNVTGYTADIFNYTLCIKGTIYGCKTIPSDPDCTFPSPCTSSVDPSLNGTNKTIMDYGDPIVFLFAALNGAGIGNTTEYIYHRNQFNSRVQVSPNTTETVRSTVSTISYTNDSKSDLSNGAVRISAAVVAIVVIIATVIIVIIVAIRCSFMKRMAYFEHNEQINVHVDSSHADACNYYSTRRTQVEDPYFLPVSDFRPTTSQDPAKSCIESGIQHQSNQEQLQCKGESSYADVVCVPIISISAPKQEVTYSEVRNTEAVAIDHQNVCEAQSVPVAQPSEQISSTPPPKYDDVVLPAESNKLEQTEPPKHMNEAPSTNGRSRTVYDDDEDVEEGVEDSIKDTPKVTSSPPSRGIRHRNPNHQRTESDGDEESFEEDIKDFMKDDIPKVYLPSSNRSQHLRRTKCDGDDESDEEEIKDLVKDDIPKQYKYPSYNRSQRLCQRVDCDGDDEDIEGTTKDLMKKDKLQVSSSASHDSSQCQQCTEYDGNEENDWCKNSTAENQATVPQQFTSGVLVETGCDDGKQRINHRTMSEDIKYDDNSSFVFSFTHFKNEHIEGQNLPTSKESSIIDDASSDAERKTLEQLNCLMHWHSIIRTVEHWKTSNVIMLSFRPHYLRPVDMPILSSIVPSVNVKELFERNYIYMYKETGCDIYLHGQDTLNDFCLKCAADNQTQQAEVALEDAGTNIATCLSMDERPRAFFKRYVESKFGAAGVGKTYMYLQQNNPAEQCFSTGLADNPIKTISSSLEDDWFQDDKEPTGNANAIKGGLDDVHRTQPQPVAMLPWFTVAVIPELLISLLLLMSGDIEENPGPEGHEGPEGREGEAAKLYAEAMKIGCVEHRIMKCFIIGAAGVGKTYIKQLILSMDPPRKHENTEVIQNPVLAVTFSRAMGNDVWSIIKKDEELIMTSAKHLRILEGETNPDYEIKSMENQSSLDTMNINDTGDSNDLKSLKLQIKPRDSKIDPNEKLFHVENTLKQKDSKISHQLLSPRESIKPKVVEVKISEKQTNKSKPNNYTGVLNKSAQQCILTTGSVRLLENANALCSKEGTDVSIHQTFIGAISNAEGMCSSICMTAVHIGGIKDVFGPLVANEGGKNIHTSTSIHFIDSELHDLLLLSRPNTSVVFKLSEGLNQMPVMEYYGPNGLLPIRDSYESYLTHKETLEHSLKDLKDAKYPTILVVGTHKDCHPQRLNIDDPQKYLEQFYKYFIQFGDALIHCLESNAAITKIFAEIKNGIMTAANSVNVWFGLDCRFGALHMFEKNSYISDIVRILPQYNDKNYCDILKLLSKLNIISKIDTSETEVFYFMPALLPSTENPIKIAELTRSDNKSTYCYRNCEKLTYITFMDLFSHLRIYVQFPHHTALHIVKDMVRNSIAGVAKDLFMMYECSQPPGHVAEQHHTPPEFYVCKKQNSITGPIDKKINIWSETDGMMEEFKKCGYFDTLGAGKIVTESAKCYESLNDLIHIPGPNGPHIKEIELYNICDYTVQCFSTALQDDKECTGNIDDIKGGLDDVHRTQPQPAPMLWITVEACYLNIINEKEVQDQAKTTFACMEPIAEVAMFWLPLDLAYGALAVQALCALCALYAGSNGNQNTWTL